MVHGDGERTQKPVNLDDVLKTKAGQLASNAHLLEAKPGRFVPPPVVAAPDRTAMRLGIQPSTDEAKLNKTETAYLGWLRALGDDWIGIQCLTIKLGADCRYTPDFWAIDKEGMRAIDVKGGHTWEDSLIKLRVAARLYPMFRFLIARKDGAGWKHTAILP